MTSMARAKKALTWLPRRYSQAMALTVAAGALVVCAAGVPGTGQASQMSGSCDNQIVRDYERPLRHLPADHLPAGGNLPFAPAGVGLAKLGFRKVFIQGDMIGYRLVVNRAKSRTGHLKHPLNLRWDVQSTLTAVDAHGRPARVVARQARLLGDVRHPEHVEFGLRGKPGLYRFDLSIRAWNGKVLGSYREYVRVVPLRVRLGIAVSGSSFHPGEHVIGRLENLGTSTAIWPAGAELKVERYDGEAWSDVRSSNSELPIDGVDEFIYGGHAGSCATFTIPSDAPTGSYRFSTEVESYGARVLQFRLASYFSVVP